MTWLRWLILAAVLLGGCVATELACYRRIVPDGRAATLAEYLAWRPSAAEFAVVETAGTRHVIAYGPKRSPMLASGPSAYVFDDTGRMVDWSADIGDDPAFDERWDAQGRGDRRVRREEVKRLAGEAHDQGALPGQGDGAAERPTMSATNEELVKVFVELKDEPFGTESFWARPLGDDLYELRNSPWYAFDLHFYDVVRAVPDEPDQKPRILEVVRRSGHKTLRVLFPPEVGEPERLEMLRSLHQWRGFYENCDGRLYAIDVEPEGDYGAVCDQLWKWEQAGLLQYETGTTGEATDADGEADAGSNEPT
jgi:hypothetical protein